MTAPFVTAHALVRYIERVGGIDMGTFTQAAKAEMGRKPNDIELVKWIKRRGVGLNHIREQIARMVCPAVKIGAATFGVAGIIFVLDGDYVVTIIDANARTSRGRY